MHPIQARAIGEAILGPINDKEATMSEKNLTSYLRKGLKGYGHLTRHEDAGTQGIPDISYGINGAQGWIECKWKAAWPKRENTPVRFEHFTPQQRLWLTLRHRAGGRCWVIVQVEKEWFLFGPMSFKSLGNWTREEMRFMAVAWWPEKIDWARLAELLGGVDEKAD